MLVHGHLALHQFGISGTEGRADQNARTQAHAVDEQDGEGHEGVGGADGGQRLLADELAHDDAVGGVDYRQPLGSSLQTR